MKKITIYLMMTIMTIFTTLVSCTKEGPAGPAGQDGVDGIDGKDGKNGNANVVMYKFDVGYNFGSTPNQTFQFYSIIDSSNRSVFLSYLVYSTGIIYKVPGWV